MLAELGKPVLEDTWMEQTVDEHVSTSEAPRLIVGMRGEWARGPKKGKIACSVCRALGVVALAFWSRKSFGVESLLE